MEVIKKAVEDYSIMVFVKGLEGKTHVMYTEETEPASDFMRRYLEKAKIPLKAMEDLRVIITNRGVRLFGEEFMGKYGIQREDMITFVKAETGGGPRPYSERPKTATLGLF
jgi:hypothetical protein